MEIQEYLDDQRKSPFETWFNKLKETGAAKVTIALYRMEQGNFSNVKSVGAGVFEYKINFGPGYRIYFGQDNDVLIILLGGGTKKQQSKDIQTAKSRWKVYKKLKKTGKI